MDPLKNFKLNIGEKVINTSHEPSTLKRKSGLVLTNDRVLYIENIAFYKKSIQSINLENLDSLETTTVKEPSLLIVGCVLMVFSVFIIFIDKEFSFITSVLFLLSLLSVIYYFLYNHKILKLSSGRTDIKLKVDKLPEDKLKIFISEIEDAKKKKFLATNKTSSNSVKDTSFKSAEERLFELKKLLDKNLITNEEYESKRNNILKDI